MSKKTKTKNLIGLYSDDVLSSDFVNDNQRIKLSKDLFKDMSIVEAFAAAYGDSISKKYETNDPINTVTNISVGQLYLGQVKEFDKNVLTFTIPGVKEELVCKENFNSCIDHMRNYLLTHNNQLMFEVREKQDNKFIVSVTNGYYRYWMKLIENNIQKEIPIDIHIDERIKGGFIGHTNITLLSEITGQEYTNSIFVPGSQIILNIEKDFDKWVGQDIEMIPQKVVDFRKDWQTGCIETSIVGSRKRMLQLVGMQNLYEMWNKKRLAEKNSNVTYEDPILHGHVTGIINSSKSHGVFIEIDDMCITGLLPISPDKLLDYHPDDLVDVKIKEFEVKDGKDAFITSRKGKVIKCNTRPVFELA